MHVYIEDIGKHEGEEVTIKGWLHNRRSSGKIHFLIVRDGTGFIQAVMSKAAVGDELFKAADHLSQETSVIVTGTARADKRAPSGYEIDVKSFEVVGASHDYPITPKEHGVDYLLDRRHLWIRTERQQAILRVRHEIIDAVRDFFNARGFILADTPIFTPAACEGTTTLFPAQYFEDQTAYLTQSGQLYNEANAMALGRVYCFGPTFRAEKSKTRRHLTEFWMVEPEMAYAELDDVMDLAEGSGRVGRRARARQAAARAEGARARHQRSSRPSRRRFRASPTTRRCRRCRRRGCRFEWGGDFGGPDETALSRAVRSAGDGASLSGGDQGVLHEARSRARRSWRSASTCSRPRATARSSAAASVSPISICCCSGSRSTTCRRRRSSGISICAATARCRTAASAWASSASSPGSAGSSTSARRSRIRACCTGCIRSAG